jgi:hypothetical protein
MSQMPSLRLQPVIIKKLGYIVDNGAIGVLSDADTIHDIVKKGSQDVQEALPPGNL